MLAGKVWAAYELRHFYISLEIIVTSLTKPSRSNSLSFIKRVGSMTIRNICCHSDSNYDKPIDLGIVMQKILRKL